MEQKIQTKLEPCLDLGILIGLLLTDGCVSVSPAHGSWKMTFTGKSEELHKIFKESLAKLFGITQFSVWFDKKGIKSTQVKRKQVVEQLLQLTPTFRHTPFEDGSLPLVKLPEFIESLTKQELAKVLQVMFSADGSICLGVKWHKSKGMWQFTRKVKLTCEHTTLRTKLFELVVKLGFKPKIISEREVTLERKSDIRRFKEVIGFISGVKISTKSKVWTGFEKSQILDLAIKTFDLKKKDLEKFKIKEEVISFLKSFLAPGDSSILN